MMLRELMLLNPSMYSTVYEGGSMDGQAVNKPTRIWIFTSLIEQYFDITLSLTNPMQ